MKSKSVQVAAIALGLTMVFWTKPASAQPAPEAPAAASTAGGAATVTRSYDVRDLLLLVPSYPISGALVPPTRLGQATSEQQAPNRVPTPASPEALASLPVDQLEKILTDNI